MHPFEVVVNGLADAIRLFADGFQIAATYDPCESPDQLRAKLDGISAMAEAMRDVVDAQHS